MQFSNDIYHSVSSLRENYPFTEDTTEMQGIISDHVRQRKGQHGGWHSTNRVLWPILQPMYDYQSLYLTLGMGDREPKDYRLHYTPHHIWRGTQWIAEKWARFFCGEQSIESKYENFYDMAGYATCVLNEIEAWGDADWTDLKYKIALESWSDCNKENLRLGNNPCWREDNLTLLNGVMTPSSPRGVVTRLLQAELFLVHDRAETEQAWRLLLDITTDGCAIMRGSMKGLDNG